VHAAARLSTTELCDLEAALHAAGLIGEPIHSYGTLTPVGERHARERWDASRPRGASGGPPRLARPYRRAGSIVARAQDRACPNCAAHAGWLTRRRSKRWDELLGRGEVDFSCPRCGVSWTIYLEPTSPDGSFDPAGDPRVCRPSWRYRGGWLYDEALAPPDHHPYLVGMNQA
jgi:hypothetical protein